MPKKDKGGGGSGGGGGGSSVSMFNIQLDDSASVGSETWVDLGLIPTGSKYQFGMVSVTSIDKAISFSLCTNDSGESQGTDSATTVLGKGSARAGNTSDVDLFRKGRLTTISVTSTGVEHIWLKFSARKSTPGDCLYIVTMGEV